MLDLRLSQLDLAQDLKEQVTVRRIDRGKTYNPQNTDTYKDLASAVDAVVMPSEAPQTILPTGEVIQEPDFKCYLFDPLESVSVGDLVIRSSGPRLFIESVFHPNNTHIMILGLRSPQQ